MSLSVLRVFAPVVAVLMIDDVMLCHMLWPFDNAVATDVPDVARPVPVAPTDVPEFDVPLFGAVPEVEFGVELPTLCACPEIGTTSDSSTTMHEHNLRYLGNIERYLFMAAAPGESNFNGKAPCSSAAPYARIS